MKILNELIESDDIFLVDDNVELSYTTVKKKVENYTSYFQEKGICPDFRVGLAADNSAESFCMYIALMRYCSCVPMPFDVNLENTGEEFNAVFWVKRLQEDTYTDLDGVHHYQGRPDWFLDEEQYKPRWNENPDETFFIEEFYHTEGLTESPGEYLAWWSSGTSAGNENRQRLGYGVTDSHTEWLTTTGHDKGDVDLLVFDKILEEYNIDKPVTFNIQPPFLSQCSDRLIVTYERQGTFICWSDWDNLSTMLNKWKPQWWYGAPNHLKALLNNNKDYDGFKLIINTGAAIDDETKNRLRVIFNCDIGNLYGVIESGDMTFGTVGVGKPYDTEYGYSYVNEAGLACYKFADGTIFETKDYMLVDDDGNWHFGKRLDSEGKGVPHAV